MKIPEIEEINWKEERVKIQIVLIRSPENIGLLERIISFCKKNYPSSMSAGLLRLAEFGLENLGY